MFPFIKFLADRNVWIARDRTSYDLTSRSQGLVLYDEYPLIYITTLY